MCAVCDHWDERKYTIRNSLVIVPQRELTGSRDSDALFWGKDGITNQAAFYYLLGGRQSPR